MEEIRILQQQKKFVDICEKSFHERLQTITEHIYASGHRLCRLTGPTCSGKTTAANMIVQALAAKGKTAHIVSIDDFYHNSAYLQELSKKKGLSTVDYDSEDTIDHEALKDFLHEIFTSDTVHCPTFDFKTGKRENGRVLHIGADDIFIIEGIQVLYPGIAALMDEHGSMSIYIAPLTSVEAGGVTYAPNEIRLLRRLVRDYNFRDTAPEVTMAMWENVRKNEEKNIFPYVERCLYRIDSTMPYEIGVLRPYLERILSDIPGENRFRSRTEEIRRKISTAEVIPAELIGENSLYREFI